MTHDHSRTHAREPDDLTDGPERAARLQARGLTPTGITILRAAENAGRRRADQLGTEPRAASAESGRLPCLSCGRAVAPKPGKDLVCSPECGARLTGTVAWLTAVLNGLGWRDPPRTRP
jgi:hypothetical protein